MATSVGKIMAFCSNCNGPMGTMDVACPSCGYDFPTEGESPSIGRGAASSTALVAGMLGAGLGAAWAALKVIASIVQGQIEMAAAALVLGLILVGLFGVFHRANNR